MENDRNQAKAEKVKNNRSRKKFFVKAQSHVLAPLENGGQNGL